MLASTPTQTNRMDSQINLLAAILCLEIKGKYNVATIRLQMRYFSTDMTLAVGRICIISYEM